MKDDVAERLVGGTPPLMVRVKAPATLPAGYTFEALLNDDPDRPFTCEVVSSEFAILRFHTLFSSDMYAPVD